MNGTQDTLLVALAILIPIGALASIAVHWLRTKLAGVNALRTSDERHRSVVNEIDAVIFRTDTAGRWTFLNPAWMQITGFDVPSSLGLRVIDFVHPHDREASEAEFDSLVDGSAEHCRHEVRLLTSNGTARWVELQARVSRNELGQLLGTVGVIRDATERRRAEEALRSAHEMAEATSRAKSEFLARMSHELRTPVNAILGFGQLMESDATTRDHNGHSTQILRAGRHLLSLINEILDITSIESGQMRLSTEPVRVSDVVTEVVDLMQPLAAPRSVQLSAEDGTFADLLVHADRQRLRQVLINLLANAVKYNRFGGRVFLAGEVTAIGRVRILVTDTGPGIPAQMMSRLFTPFDRLGSHHAVEGTGLGLALSKRLVEAMRGAIGVQTVAGAGSTFWVELPRAHAAPATEGIEFLFAKPVTARSVRDLLRDGTDSAAVLCGR